MHKKLFKKNQTAQGMLEFALVLPILLVLILGIFAFGHMFFVYTSVVTASREAARWGAAVGEAPAAIPRYQDCDAIRATAVRRGSFAGVNASNIENPDDTGIDITFDHGPDTDPLDETCNGSIGPATVVMGDRIVVRVKVDYAPIVPLVNIPSFPLEATTFRTILRSVPVGEAPTAVDPCTSPTHIELDTVSSVVGEAVTHTVWVIADDIQTDYPPSGEVYLYDDYGDTPYSCEGMLAPDPDQTDRSIFTCPDPATYPRYMAVGPRSLHVVYTSDDGCFLSADSAAPGPDPIHEVLPADTELIITTNPATGYQNNSLMVNVTVRPLAPGGGIPQGFVMVQFPAFLGSIVRQVALDPATGAGSTLIVPNASGTGLITADYLEEVDENYGASQGSYTLTVIAATPTLITPPPTVIPSETTEVPPPVVPSYCPQLNGSVSFSDTVIDIPIRNPNEKKSSKTEITSVGVTWPNWPTANLQEFRFGAASSLGTCDTGGNGNCLWRSAAGLGPTYQLVSGGAGWDADFADIAKNASQTLRMVFNATVPQGNYRIVITFKNGCSLDLRPRKNE